MMHTRVVLRSCRHLTCAAQSLHDHFMPIPIVFKAFAWFAVYIGDLHYQVRRRHGRPLVLRPVVFIVPKVSQLPAPTVSHHRRARVQYPHPRRPLRYHYHCHQRHPPFRHRRCRRPQSDLHCVPPPPAARAGGQPPPHPLGGRARRSAARSQAAAPAAMLCECTTSSARCQLERVAHIDCTH